MRVALDIHQGYLKVAEAKTRRIQEESNMYQDLRDRMRSSDGKTENALFLRESNTMFFVLEEAARIIVE